MMMKSPAPVFLLMALALTPASSSSLMDTASSSSSLMDSLVDELKVSPSMNVECLLEHCAVQAGECVLDKDCRSACLCSQKCMGQWDLDNTTEKVHVQNCTNICAFSYTGKVYEDFIGCVASHECLSFPPIPSRCQGPDNITLLKKLAPQDLNGCWSVVSGRHPVYDCYPCQYLCFNQINATSWAYSPKYQVYLANGSLELVSQTMIIPNTSPGEKVSFVYNDVGLPHYETWWLIDQADDKSYILLYYCGHTLEWNYDGALVFAREKSLPASDTASISNSYLKAAGLDYSKFCSTKTSQCPDQTWNL